MNMAPGIGVDKRTFIFKLYYVSKSILPKVKLYQNLGLEILVPQHDFASSLLAVPKPFLFFF